MQRSEQTERRGCQIGGGFEEKLIHGFSRLIVNEHLRDAAISPFDGNPAILPPLKCHWIACPAFNGVKAFQRAQRPFGLVNHGQPVLNGSRGRTCLDYQFIADWLEKQF
ncbi:MAG TPA: hypothetical protein VGG64_17165 [Pirellulales bacterium]